MEEFKLTRDETHAIIACLTFTMGVCEDSVELMGRGTRLLKNAMKYDQFADFTVEFMKQHQTQSPGCQQ